MAITQAVGRIHDDVSKLAEDNLYHLEYLSSVAKAMRNRKDVTEANTAEDGEA